MTGDVAANHHQQKKSTKTLEKKGCSVSTFCFVAECHCRLPNGGTCLALPIAQLSCQRVQSTILRESEIEGKASIAKIL